MVFPVDFCRSELVWRLGWNGFIGEGGEEKLEI
jgi:hypothetical protein